MLPELDSSIYVISGPVYSKVVTVHPYILHEVILYNVTGKKSEIDYTFCLIESPFM